MIENGSMKVAVVKLSSIGDVVHALPVAVALKRSSAALQVSWIAEAREAALLAGHPAIDEVIVADTRGWRRARPRLTAARAALGVTRALRRRGFDVAIDLQGLIKSGLLTAATRAPRRIGFAAPFRRERPSALFTNENVRPPASARHVVDQYLALLRPLGITDTAVEFGIPIDAAAETRADELLARAGIKAHDRLVLVNPGAGRPNKRWPVERFRELARRLADEVGARVVLLWGPGEEDDARAVAAGAAGALIAPPTTLRELVALARRARLVIAGDTGPLHIAAAVGTPCVGFYGPTSGVRNGPYGAGHRVLQGEDGHVASIGVPTALAAAVAVLEAGA
jgi:lipopolysaccharide heptosyltransferase I